MANLKNTFDTPQSILNEALDKTARAWKTLLYGYDGSAWQSLHVDSSGDLQVDVLSGGGGGTQYTEDEAAAANPVGTALIGIRADTLAGLTTADGDNVAARMTDKGELYVKHSDKISIYSIDAGDNNIGNVDVLTMPAITGTVTANLSATDNAVLDAIELDTTAIAGAVSGTEMQVDVITMPSVAVTNAGLTELAAAINVSSQMDVNLAASGITLPVSGTFYQATQPVSAATLPLPIGASTSALQGAGLPAALGAGGGVKIDGSGTSLPVTEASASAIKTSVELIDNAISGTEMQVDVVAALPAGTNAIGKLLQPDIDVTTNTNYAKKYYTSAGAVTDGIIWSPAAGKRWHIHTIYINVSAAATVTLEDDLAAGDSAIWKGELAANSGVVLTFPEKYPWASGEDAADLIVTTSAGNIYITCSGIEI